MVWYHFPTRDVRLVNRKGTNMLIKFEADDAEVSQIKLLTGQAVGSKAYSLAAQYALELTREVRDLKAQLAQANSTIAVQRQTLHAARSAAAQLLEKVGQGDLLNS